MLKESGVELRLRTTVVEGQAGVRVQNKRITALAVTSSANSDPTGDGNGTEWVQVAYVIDASYGQLSPPPPPAHSTSSRRVRIVGTDNVCLKVGEHANVMDRLVHLRPVRTSQL